MKDAHPRQNRPGTIALGPETLTQHDGIHSSSRTELDHDLQKTPGKVMMSRGAQPMRWRTRGAQSQPRQDQPVPIALTRQPLLLLLPQDLSSLHTPTNLAPALTGGSNTQGSCWGTSLFRKRKTKLPWKPVGSVNSLFSQAHTLPFPSHLSCSLVPTCQLPYFLHSTAGVSEDTFQPHTSQPSPPGISAPVSCLSSSCRARDPGCLGTSGHQGFEDKLR